MNLRYAVLRQGQPPAKGLGASVNVSRTGLLFTANGRLERGDLILAALDWPLLAIDGQPLYLVVSGHVARVKKPLVAIWIRTHRLWRASELKGKYEAFFGSPQSNPSESGNLRAS
jgi:hypothetical protein